MKETIIEDTVLMNKFDNCIASIKFLNVGSGIDVRKKIYFYFTQKQYPMVICIDRFNSLLVDGKRVTNAKKLIELITSVSK